MDDAFAHHVWATQRLLDVCAELTSDQLTAHEPGTFGSIMRTQRHIVGSDAWYLLCITGDHAHAIDEDHMDLMELRAAMDDNGEAWSSLVDRRLDPDLVIEEVDGADGSATHATIGIRLAQALHHGTDHRSQICTALTSLGVEPPAIDVWAFGMQSGRVVEIPPADAR